MFFRSKFLSHTIFHGAALFEGSDILHMLPSWWWIDECRQFILWSFTCHRWRSAARIWPTNVNGSRFGRIYLRKFVAWAACASTWRLTASTAQNNHFTFSYSFRCSTAQFDIEFSVSKSSNCSHHLNFLRDLRVQCTLQRKTEYISCDKQSLQPTGCSWEWNIFHFSINCCFV